MASCKQTSLLSSHWQIGISELEWDITQSGKDNSRSTGLPFNSLAHKPQKRHDISTFSRGLINLLCQITQDKIANPLEEFSQLAEQAKGEEHIPSEEPENQQIEDIGQQDGNTESQQVAEQVHFIWNKNGINKCVLGEAGDADSKASTRSQV